MNLTLSEGKNRGGLPFFKQKLQQAHAVSIAYFGGSITDQPGWRVQSLARLRKQYPQVSIQGIHAAIGGTNSILGAMRCASDVIARKPDLVFLEFSVNDRDAPPEEIARAQEGIVRQIRKSLPETDLCYVHTVIQSDMENLAKGVTKGSVASAEEIADYYRIPSVNWEKPIFDLYRQNKIVLKTDDGGMLQPSGRVLDVSSEVELLPDGRIPFSKDGVHPYPNTGHKIYTDVLMKRLREMLTAGAAPSSRSLPPPLRADCMEHIRSLDADSPEIRNDGQCMPPDSVCGRLLAERGMPCVKLAPGQSLVFSVSGVKQIFCYLLLGPGCGVLNIQIDGKTQPGKRLIDRYCHYYRLANLEIARDLNPQNTVQIKLTIDGAAMDKRALLRPVSVPYFDRDPAMFEAYDGYFGRFFLLG